MKVSMIKWVKKNLLILLLVVLWVSIIVTNFKPDTWLIGWDNLIPELNFGLNIKKSLFAVWQEYQGLGLLGGMGHSSELFRQIILWLFSFIFPTSFLRYLFHFLMLITGAIGIFFLVKNFVLEKYSEDSKKLGAFTSSIFYLLNLGTLQMFYVPFEAYSVHFGFIPWIFFVTLNYLKAKNKKNLLWLFVVNLLAVAQGFVITFFFVYFLALILILIVYILIDKSAWKRIVATLLLVFAINSFWLLPNLYFVFTSVNTNVSAKINLMSTENNFLMNKKYGDIKNIALVKGFWFDTVEINNKNFNDNVMGSWVDYLKTPYVKGIGYFLFGLSVCGLLLAVKGKNKNALLFLPLFLLSFTFLANDTFGFSLIDKLLYKLPLVSQIFRFPFTKFSILLVFCLAIFYGVFAAEIAKRGLRVMRVAGVSVILLPIVFMFPIFQGKLFYFKERAKIPQEYFEVFKFFKEQDKNTRIANFPQPVYWGWTMYDWGKSGPYSGSGFLWYGIEQPIMDRAFDVWSSANENYFWEISYALYSKNKELFEKVLEKYQINWLLVDGNVIYPGSSKALFLDEFSLMLEGDSSVVSQNDKFMLEKTFGKIKIYKVNLQTPVKDFVFIENNLPAINSYDWGNLDEGYGEYGGYVAGGNGFDIYYPFRSLFTGRTSEDLDFEIEDKGDHYIFKKKLPEDVQNYDLIEPEYSSRELGYLSSTDSAKINYFIPRTEVVNGNIEVNVPKISNLTTVINPFYVPTILNAENCNQFNEGTVVTKALGESKTVQLEAVDATNCSTQFYLPELIHKYAYLISVESKNASGKSLLFWIDNLTNHKADLELYLDQKSNNSTPYNLTPNTYIIQPPMAEDGLGYTLHFDNISIGREKTVNELGKITLNPIPYEYLMGIKLINQNAKIKNQNQNQNQNEELKAKEIVVNHPNPSLYEVKINGAVSESETLVLSQAYHEGWLGYEINSKFKMQSSKLWRIFPFFYGERLEHVKVNNWENGWQLNSKFKVQSSKLTEEKLIILIFWPQYLEYFGFGFMVVSLIIVIARNVATKQSRDRHGAKPLAMTE